MLKLVDIKKTYHVADIETKALDGISVSFREKEFVAILGSSGSGKTTCLNIVGGLDQYDSGDLIIKGKSTKDFKDKDWDAYRNNSIGFVFQSYNLIHHLSIVDNVELGMTLSGMPTKEKHAKALEVLTKVGLKDHLHKKPNQLSGGQMQRVAIARALANDPEILLCDEPTGALDTQTSIQIMDLIKEVANDRLVVMVTHNPEIAEAYADRIIRFSDGKIMDDTNPYEKIDKDETFSLKKTSMSYPTALKLSFNNLRMKKGRTFLTSFASSIGIIGIAVILSLSTGFQGEIDAFQSDTMGEFPIIITSMSAEMDADQAAELNDGMTSRFDTDEESYVDLDYILVSESYEPEVHTNDLSDEFLAYVEAISSDICASIGYTRMVNMNILSESDGEYSAVSFGSITTMMSSSMSSTSNLGLSVYPTTLEGDSYLEQYYDLVAGEYPSEATDLVLIVDSANEIDEQTLISLGFDVEADDELEFEDIIGTTYKLIDNNDYYVATAYGTYMPGTDYESMYESEDSITLTITGIVKSNPDNSMSMLSSGISYSDALSQLVIDNATNSDIVVNQQEVDYNIMTMEAFEEESDKETFITYLGGSGTPFMIMLFPEDFDTKEEVTAYLDEYNVGKDADDKIVYTDLAETISNLTGSIIDGITLVLIAFASISLVVSMIMISIITYVSVLERTKEIGILKALGARKKDITRVFDAETLILGVFSGTLGVSIAYACTFPINNLINNIAGLENASNLKVEHMIILVIISATITFLGGYIPAKLAANKDAVEALRSE